MSVSLSPSNSLGFNRPLTVFVKCFLTISNYNHQPVAFKVKTSARKRYYVRPKFGRVDPGESFDVSVTLQPLKEEPPLDAICKDKFLIESTLITADNENTPLSDIWNTTDEGKESKVHQQKLAVVYWPAEGPTLGEDDGQANIGESRYEPISQHPSTSGLSNMAQEGSPEEPNTDLLAKYNEAKAEIERLRTLLAALPNSPPTEHRRRTSVFNGSVRRLFSSAFATTSLHSNTEKT